MCKHAVHAVEVRMVANEVWNELSVTRRMKLGSKQNLTHMSNL